MKFNLNLKKQRCFGCSGQRALLLLHKYKLKSSLSLQFYSVNCLKRNKINEKLAVDGALKSVAVVLGI